MMLGCLDYVCVFIYIYIALSKKYHKLPKDVMIHRYICMVFNEGLIYVANYNCE